VVGDFAFTKVGEKKSTCFRSKNEKIFMTRRARKIFGFKFYFLDKNVSMTRADELLQFWFGEEFEKDPFRNSSYWFEKNPAFDLEIKTRFEREIDAAMEGQLEDWKRDAKGRLAFIILLDQFSRNIYRGTPRMFSQDAVALEVTLEGIRIGADRLLHPIQRTFFYLPFVHSEDLKMQEKALEIYSQLLKEADEKFKKALSEKYQYAARHQEIIRRFGRFPHRNTILGRPSTADEIEFLKEPGSSF
jgi:uncharacterized protein (DUF924 family)